MLMFQSSADRAAVVTPSNGISEAVTEADLVAEETTSTTMEIGNATKKNNCLIGSVFFDRIPHSTIFISLSVRFRLGVFSVAQGRLNCIFSKPFLALCVGRVLGFRGKRQFVREMYR